MILTCPACGTQYVVKDDAIPPQGRQVRCSACRHRWHQDPENGAGEDENAAAGGADGAAVTSADEVPSETAGPADIPTDITEPVAPPVAGLVEPPLAAPIPPPDEDQPGEETSALPALDQDQPQDSVAADDFMPFARRDETVDERRRSPLLLALVGALLIAALAAAFWFLAPTEWKQQLGLAQASETPLQLMMTHRDRQKLASGNELLTVSGRVINPTNEAQQVPPIHAQLHNRNGELIYSWTIAPPARTLPPGGSASFNSAEFNVPPGGDDLTITLGDPAA
jgi:predicted Zn finger-like uncharacterized protein